MIEKEIKTIKMFEKYLKKDEKETGKTRMEILDYWIKTLNKKVIK